MSARMSLLDAGVTQHSGWLEKLGGAFHRTWQPRFFVLTRSHLFWFEKESASRGGASNAKGSLLIAGATMRALDAASGHGRSFCFGVTPACGTREYMLAAETEEARIEWLSALLKAGAVDAEGGALAPSSASDVTSMERPHRRASASNVSAAATAAMANAQQTPLPDRMFAASKAEGWLRKLGGLNKDTLQARYFALLGDHLLYYKQAGYPDSVRNTVSLAGAEVQIEPQGMALFGEPFVFTLRPKEMTKSSLFSTLFGETLKKYVLVCKSEKELDTWVTALRAAADGAAVDCEDGSDESDDEGHSVGSHSHSRTPHAASPASPTATDGLGSTTATSFVPPTADLMSHFYRVESDAVDSAGDGNWKKRYFALDLSSRSLRVWRHKPSPSSTPSKPRRIDLSTADVLINGQVSCPKAKAVPVLTLIFSATPEAHGRHSHSSATRVLHLAPSSKARSETWHSFLLLATGPSQSRRRQSSDGYEPAAHVPGPTPFKTRATSDNSAPAHTPGRQRRNSNSAAGSRPESPLPPSPTPVSPAARPGTKPQSQLLAEMSAALGDDAAMQLFKQRSVELHRGELTALAYFTGYWRLFGKEDGARFWEELLLAVPRADIRQELSDLYTQHAHLFGPEEPGNGDPSAAGAGPSVASPPTDSSTSPEPSPVVPAMPSFKPLVDDPVMPSFVVDPPPKSACTPPSTLDSASDGRRSAPSPAPASPASNKPTAAPAAASPAPPAESDSDMRDRVCASVQSWSQRGEHNIITLLCTLHEVLPGVISPGAFIPFEDGYPSVKEVHSCYLRALRVLHPDKLRDKSHEMQALSNAVFQAVQGAWEKWDKQEKKKAKKAAEREETA